MRRSVAAGRLVRSYFFSPEARCSPMSEASSPGRCSQPTFRPAAPTHGFPFGAGQHLFCRSRQDIWHVVLSWFPRTLVIGQMSFTSTGYTFRCRGMPTAQASPRSVSPCRNGALSPYPASASTHPKRTLAAIARSISAKAISGWDCVVRCSTGTRARFKRDTSLV